MPQGDGTGPIGQGAGRGQGRGGRMKGQGQMRGSSARGRGGNCICLRCGYSLVHTQGQPCNKKSCPKCGMPLTRG